MTLAQAQNLAATLTNAPYNCDDVRVLQQWKGPLPPAPGGSLEWYVRARKGGAKVTSIVMTTIANGVVPGPAVTAQTDEAEFV